jgi:hypothetical protein
MNEIIWHEIDKDFWCEIVYITNIINYINEEIANYSIVITPNLNVLPETKYKKIVILTGDELGNLGMKPYTNQDVLCVFRIYNRIGRFDNNYIFPIPCGYNWTMHSDRSKKMVKMYFEKKLQEREYDIFYSGQYMYTRQPLIDSLNRIRANGKNKISCNIYNGFRTGIEIDQYYKLLGNCKISLAPDGTSVDTFRYVESFGSGCVVISTQKDDLWYYKNSPVFLLNSWSELNQKLIDDILSMNLDELYEKNLEYYNNYLSEKSVAEYMIKKIKIIK